MCFQEYIAYQCGHRSLSVVRPCPLTTTGHNFPVCAIQPTKQYFSETMCAACERQLHSRWVLIREWEHRWLHERGACGCDVCFPGLLTTPRVIGGKAVTDAATTGTSSTLTADDHESYRNSSTPTATGSNAGYAESNQHSTGSGRVPAIYSEAVTSSGEHRVAIRLPSLYAAEWLADHRALHTAGKCSCNADFRSVQPQIPDEELTPADQDVVHRWHQMEMQTEQDEPHARDPYGENDDGSRRIAEIERIFGSFTAGGETPRVNLPPAPTLLTGGHQGLEVNNTQEGSRRGHRHDRRHASQNQTRHGVQPDPRSRSQTQNSASAQQQSALQLQPTAAPYHPIPFTATQQTYQYPGYQFMAGGANLTAALAPYPLYTEYPVYQQHPFYHPPAHPYYVTPATYTDTIPFGAHPWGSRPQVVPGVPGLTSGPGPYRTPGISHDAPPASAQQVAHQNQSQGRQAITSSPNQQTPLAVCGLPVGAGPEAAQPQMPSWRNCRLRSLRTESEGARSSTRSSMRYYSASEGGGGCGGGGGDGDGGRDDDCGGEDRDGGDEEEPPPPPRRNSAST
ncbi:hypothetical protein MFIFM68171_01017 [Madurella fahalii]|uniref:Uncharacterized protein n=1 Tax=Madurella fahalii TaxID=1157608 RepID=A0ABQ0FZ73_9PEZI